MARHRRGGAQWKALRTSAYRRDMKRQAPCWICGQPIDYQAPAGTPDAWEPDHIKPVSKYPELELAISNIAPSHCSCNRSRGDGSGADRVGPTTREW